MAIYIVVLKEETRYEVESTERTEHNLNNTQKFPNMGKTSEKILLIINIERMKLKHQPDKGIQNVCRSSVRSLVIYRRSE